LILVRTYDLACNGDRNAQAQIAKGYAHFGFTGEFPIEAAFRIAEMWARAAAHSGALDHRLSLVGVLLCRCGLLPDAIDDSQKRDELYAEAIEMLVGAAGEGSDQAATALLDLSRVRQSNARLPRNVKQASQTCH
jgi:hypothetical protein